jgi:hypothetical protein
LSLIEIALVYSEYEDFNLTGKRQFNSIFLIVVIRSIRRTFVNLFFLLTALGFGTLTNRLGRYTQSIGVIAFLMFFTSAVNNLF